MKISPSSSGLKNKSSNKPAETGYKLNFALSCLAYSSIPNVDAIWMGWNVRLSLNCTALQPR
jgi:hypothetical protein